jgi:hypothetical protein
VRLFEPLGPAFVDRATQAALAGLGKATPVTGTGDSPASVVPLHAPPRRRMLWALVPMAAAAGIALWAMRPPPAGRLAEYGLELTGGLADTRSDDPAARSAPKLGPGARLNLVLRPTRESNRPVVAQAWLARDGKLQAWPVVPEISPAGAVRIAGSFEALGLGGLAPGEWEAVVVVAPTDHLPDEAEIAATLTDAPPSDAPWRLQRGRFLIAGPPGGAP